MNQFEKLDIWNESLEIITNIYQITKTYPTSERFGLSDQIKRAANSMALNIAEGRGRSNDKEFSRFLSISLGSSYEVIAGLKISTKLGFIKENQVPISIVTSIN